jgi:hypothetical protein
MGRPRAEEPKTEQVNVRLTREQLEILDVDAFVGRTTVSEIVRNLVLAHVAVKKNDPMVQRGLRLRAEADGVETGEVAIFQSKAADPA